MILPTPLSSNWPNTEYIIFWLLCLEKKLQKGPRFSICYLTGHQRTMTCCYIKAKILPSAWRSREIYFLFQSCLLFTKLVFELFVFCALCGDEELEEVKRIERVSEWSSLAFAFPAGLIKRVCYQLYLIFSIGADRNEFMARKKAPLLI